MKKYFIIIFFINASAAFSQLNTAQEIIEKVRIECGIKANWLITDFEQIFTLSKDSYNILSIIAHKKENRHVENLHDFSYIIDYGKYIITVEKIPEKEGYFITRIEIPKPEIIYSLKGIHYNFDWYINQNNFGFLIDDFSIGNENELIYEIKTYMYLGLCFKNKQLDKIIFIYRVD